MNDLTSLREIVRSDPTLMLRLQLMLVLVASLVVPLIGLLMSFLREWTRRGATHSR